MYKAYCVVLKPLNNVFLTKSLSQRLSHNVFVISFSQSLSHNVILTKFFSHHHSHNVMLTMSFSQHHSHNVFLTTSFSQRCPNLFIYTWTYMYAFFVFLTTSFSHRCSYTVHIRPHNVVLTTSQYTRNVSVLYTNLKISHICLSSDPVISTFFIHQIETSTLHICNIYSVNVGSFRTLGQRIHTKVPRTRCCTNFPKYLKILEVQTPVILPIFGR